MKTSAEGSLNPQAGTLDSRPNVLFIVTDQEQSWKWLDQLSLVKGSRFNFERDLPARALLRRHGVDFVNHHSATAPCSPSRSALYTGHHAPTVGVVENMDFDQQQSLDERIWTFAQALHAVYGQDWVYCAYKGKSHLDKRAEHPINPEAPSYQDMHGFKDWEGTFLHLDLEGPRAGYQLDKEVMQQAHEWLLTKGRTLSSPWLLSLDLINPHDIMFVDTDGCEGPYQRPTSKLIPLAAVQNAAPFNVWRLPDWDPVTHTPTWYPDYFQDDDGETSTRPPAHQEFASLLDIIQGQIDYNAPLVDARDGDRIIRRHMWEVYVNYYINCMIATDILLLPLLSRILEGGSPDFPVEPQLAANTLVIFTSDHGEQNMSHRVRSEYNQQLSRFPLRPADVPMRQKGPFIYAGNLNVPLVVASNSRQLVPQPGVATPALSSHLDLAPTVLDYLGVSKSTYTEAYQNFITMLPLATNEERAWLKRFTQLRGVSLKDVVDAPQSYAQPRWKGLRSGEGRKGVLFTYDCTSTLSADALVAAIKVRDGMLLPDEAIPLVIDPRRTLRGFIRGFFDGRQRFGVYFNSHEYAAWGENRVPEGADRELYLFSTTRNGVDEHTNQNGNSAAVRAAEQVLLELIRAELPDAGTPPDTVIKGLVSLPSAQPLGPTGCLP